MFFFSFTAERARPYLLSNDKSDDSDFINGVYVDVSINHWYLYANNHITELFKESIFTT